jgi:hypothetical protein
MIFIKMLTSLYACARILLSDGCLDLYHFSVGLLLHVVLVQNALSRSGSEFQSGRYTNTFDPFCSLPVRLEATGSVKQKEVAMFLCRSPSGDYDPHFCTTVNLMLLATKQNEHRAKTTMPERTP